MKNPAFLPQPVPDLEEILGSPVRRERAQKERAEISREDDDPRFVITLVHGTFAGNATWVEKDSPLSTSLRSRLPPPARIDPFKWDGANSARSRAEAVARLQEHLRALRNKYVHAHHAIIAHSHGGNIAITALADPALAKGTLGVATLGTPFLSATLRRSESLIGGFDGIVAAIFSGIAVFALGAALGHGRRWWLAGLITAGAIGVALLIAGYVASLMRAHAKRVCDGIPATALRPEQLAIVRTSSDEAAAVLSGARVAGASVNLLWYILSWRVVRVLRSWLEIVDYGGMRAITRDWELRRSERMGLSQPGWPGNALTALPTQVSWESAWQAFRQYAIPSLPLLILSLLDASDAPSRWIGAAMAVGYGLLAIVALLVNVASLPFGIVLALGLLPCGWSLPFAGPYLNLTAEPAPPGTWSVTQLQAGSEGGGLSHGKAHDDEEVFKFVGAWLAGRASLMEANAQPPSPPASAAVEA